MQPRALITMSMYINLPLYTTTVKFTYIMLVFLDIKNTSALRIHSSTENLQGKKYVLKHY